MKICLALALLVVELSSLVSPVSLGLVLLLPHYHPWASFVVFEVMLLFEVKSLFVVVELFEAGLEIGTVIEMAGMVSAACWGR